MRTDVIIAGGGQIGLTLALALSRAFAGEMTVAVVDAGPLAHDLDGRRADVRAFAVGAATRRLLDHLGVWTSVAADAQHVARVEITDSRLTDGVRPVMMAYDTRLDDGEPAMTIVPSAALERALRSAVRTAAGVRLIGQTRILATERGAHNATLRLSDDAVLSAPLLVAADGRASAQRAAADIKTVGWGHAQTAIVTAIEHELAHGNCAMQHFLPGGPFALLPLPGQRCCVTWSEDAATAARIMALPDAEFLGELDLRVGGRLGRIALAGPRQTWPLSTFLARALIEHRLALVGDAARGVHPLAGQGLNLGMRDVAALTDVIAAAARSGQDIGSTAILSRYEQWRRADGAMSAASFDLLNRLFSNDSTLLRGVRDAGLGIVDRLPMLKRQFVAEAAGLTGDLPTLLKPTDTSVAETAPDPMRARP